ncbi:hypothetical protein NTGM5_180073 [Candidatus Nitrotoga sp. M5]|nr:hypothetical protein NTGM5_180073 [Candidatus Nitrotoga sp. M5]
MGGLSLLCDLKFIFDLDKTFWVKMVTAEKRIADYYIMTGLYRSTLAICRT